MSSPAVSTPSSAGSPAALAPAPPQYLAIKPTLSMSSSLPTPPIVTRKEWVIPPRPKPGRKPATDTPPTKRKAQNRAAQRAFRERRAARVGELEEQLDETKEEYQRREDELRDRISRLEADVNRYSGELQAWRVRCETLDRIVEYERGEKEAAYVELSYLRNGAKMRGTDAVPLPPRRSNHQSTRPRVAWAQPAPLLEVQDQPQDTIQCGNCSSTTSCACADAVIEMAHTGCGNCTPDTRCACLEETIQAMSNDTSQDMDLKRPHSPSEGSHDQKRARFSVEASSPVEIDFTARFSSKPQPPVRQSPPDNAPIHLPDRSSLDSCGFCEDGTYCVCAEAAANATVNHGSENRLAPILNEVTPPPSDSDVTSVETNSYKLPSMQPNHMHRAVAPTPQNNSCADGPGTCQQCQSDPKSGLFCRSLAAIRAANPSAAPDGCCGGGGASGGCCKSQAPQSQTPKAPILSKAIPMNTSQQPPSVSCADAYKTLSTHKNFDKASDELNTWLGRLTAATPTHTGRPAMEVEAASVMGVLKLFDRRFGRG